MNMILKLLLFLELLLGVIDLNNAMHAGKGGEIINCYSMASSKSVGLEYDKKWKVAER